MSGNNQSYETGHGARPNQLFKDFIWVIKSPEISTSSGSGNTLSPITPSSLDFYSPSMFPQDCGFDMSNQPYSVVTSTGMEDTHIPSATWPMVDPSTPFLQDLEVDDSNLMDADPSHNQANMTNSIARGSIQRRTLKAEQSSKLANIESNLPTKSTNSKASLSKPPKGKCAKLVKSRKSSVYQPPRPSTSCEGEIPSYGFDPADRTIHNLTERKYRNRLNEQFDTLLSALPASAMNSRSIDDSSETRRISKAEVLILAKERIESLERENRELECERCKFRESLEFLKLTYGTSIDFPGQ
ncbi:HLH, helix-loop-helix DNA-binding protein [Glarea lozoyensis ATCC 20868]|uniref:HLH, helix-loop-helix DNA-binding protein n=1 Tax=Glarea lozoyensis (strain ATCC 20868 / MF5171) TaxID=1116229 RepID=S3CK98_GLAL2|nr:HLH, helix-loop-helix DNA-binding protein [Glarea lozoyensis ATCC 20868]EPE25644.1 HLH, helix-loop-helix DNA-binding protein [Glarea lozoyensis ATCC 20868]